MKRTGLVIELIIVISSMLMAACGAEALEAAPETATEAPLAAEEAKGIPALSPTPTLTPEPSPTQDAGEEKTGKGLGAGGRDNPFAPVPADTQWVSGNVYLDMREVGLLKNNKIGLKLAGNLPTPCHQLRVMISEPDDEKQIRIEVYSVANPDEMCIQILAPFEAEIPLGSFDEGEYAIWVNGEQIGEFQVPQ